MAFFIFRFISRTTELDDNIRTPAQKTSIKEKNSQLGSTITEKTILPFSAFSFDSTIDLCLSVFWWARFRKRKGGVKVHFLYDVETQIPAFFRSYQ